jgi:hypothetical protein
VSPFASIIFFSAAADLASPPEVHQCKTSTSAAKAAVEALAARSRPSPIDFSFIADFLFGLETGSGKPPCSTQFHGMASSAVETIHVKTVSVVKPQYISKIHDVMTIFAIFDFFYYEKKSKISKFSAAILQEFVCV